MDMEMLACEFITRLRSIDSGVLKQRYNVDVSEDMTSYEVLEAIGRRRGFLISGGEINTERAAIILMDEFRSGKLGRISLELP
jgi:ribosome biogenesis GTPase A